MKKLTGILVMTLALQLGAAATPTSVEQKAVSPWSQKVLVEISNESLFGKTLSAESLIYIGYALSNYKITGILDIAKTFDGTAKITIMDQMLQVSNAKLATIGGQPISAFSRVYLPVSSVSRKNNYYGILRTHADTTKEIGKLSVTGGLEHFLFAKGNGSEKDKLTGLVAQLSASYAISSVVSVGMNLHSRNYVSYTGSAINELRFIPIVDVTATKALSLELGVDNITKVGAFQLFGKKESQVYLDVIYTL